MAINLSSSNPISFLTSPAASPQTAAGETSSFWNSLKEALGQANTLQHEASYNAQQLALGVQDYLHTPMIAYEKASLALQLTIEIRNRLVESYQEIMRMQM